MSPHRLDIRIYYEDTDFSGFVYHANYLRFMERGRTDYLRSLGVTQSRLREENGLVFVVSRLAVDYLRPAAMDDVVTVATSPREVRGPLIRLHQEVLREGQCLVRGDVDVVAVRGGRATRLPPQIARLLQDAKNRMSGGGTDADGERRDDRGHDQKGAQDAGVP